MYSDKGRTNIGNTPTYPFCDEQHSQDEECSYTPPTIEEWHAIVDAFTYLDMDATLEGGGAACTYIEVNLPDGRLMVVGDNGDFWTANVYAHTSAWQHGMNPQENIITDVPTRFDGTDRYHDPESIAEAVWTGLGNKRRDLLATSDGVTSIRPACPWCRESHNPDITCRQQPATPSEAFTALLSNHLVLITKLSMLLREVL